MNYYYCSSRDKKIELENYKRHFKSKSHMIKEGTVINKYTIMNPKICEKKRHIIN